MDVESYDGGGDDGGDDGPPNEGTSSGGPKRRKRRPYQEEALRAGWSELRPGSPVAVQIATGGGKTLVANDLVERWLDKSSSGVIWVTKDWRLLDQAVTDLCGRYPRAKDVARLGGWGTVLSALPEGRARVRYTTIQTLASRLGEKPLADVGLLVWDECHWGEHGKAGRKILEACARARIAVLGLSATPRPPERSAFRVVYSKPFAELVQEGWLARPLPVEALRSGVSWRPEVVGRGLDFSRRSLRVLAENEQRNRRIVEHYVQNAGRYGRTIVFACTTEHATRLARMFGDAGIKARAIHSHNTDQENREHLDAFVRHGVDVVVNVEMLTTGIDVPSAKTVVLARPTTSDILLSQMIGRASRPDPDTGKVSFHIVELTDNLERLGDVLHTTKRFFEGSGKGRAGRVDRAPANAPRHGEALPAGLHRYDPDGAPTGIPDAPSVPAAMRGLWYLEGQTFGFEIELTDPAVADPRKLAGTKRWRTVAEELRRALAGAVPSVAPRVFDEYQGILGDKSPEQWNVELDTTAGWEITSRVLCGENGYAEVVAAAAAIDRVAQRCGLEVNARTGLHVHLAWRARDVEVLTRFLRLVRLFEPALASIVAPSRVAAFDYGRYFPGEPNPYVRPLATVVRAGDVARTVDRARLAPRFEAADARYLTVNPAPLFLLERDQTVEIRMHHGTTDASKMLLWLSLWQQLLWAAGRPVVVPHVPDVTALEPNGALLRLARQYLPPATQASQQVFLARLERRRAEIVAEWRRRGLSDWADKVERDA